MEIRLLVRVKAFGHPTPFNVTADYEPPEPQCADCPADVGELSILRVETYPKGVPCDMGQMTGEELDRLYEACYTLLAAQDARA